VTDKIYDIFVIGGGINGCGIARDAQGRGFSAFLAEMNDLGSGTSSWSTKLIHGGLRYLEYYEFRLVRESLAEREVLLRAAPHIIRPLRFILPHHEGLRPAWLLRLGLFFYDNLGGRKLLPPTRSVDLRRDPAGKPLKPLFKRGFEYSDASVDDTRLVVLNARDAAARGAEIRTGAKVARARRENGLWRVTVEDRATSRTEEISARLLVNAAGPWVDHVIGRVDGLRGRNKPNVRLVQGSHIVVSRKGDDPRAFIFQNADNRIVFAIPFHDEWTLIGTTDRDYSGDPADVKITREEIDYLCGSASEYFSEAVRPEDVVWAYSGVRPLYDDGASKAQEATRDYVLKAEGEAGEPRLLNIFGGKITTYRRLSEAMLEKIEAVLGRRGKPWTAGAALPGGGFTPDRFETEAKRFRAAFSFLGETHARRLFTLYGSDAPAILGSATSTADLGRCFGADLYEREVAWLMANEWAREAEDVLWRRTKLGLKLSPEEVVGLDAWMAGLAGTRRAAAAE
jgi:glycerol-3-phosphate dehydrogenase